MSVLIEGVGSTSLVEVGVGDAKAAEVEVLPVPHSILGHYRSSGRFSLVASQAADSRLWTIRNGTPNLVVPTRFRIAWTQTGAHTAAIRDTLKVFKSPAFSNDDTTSIVTPAITQKRTAGMVSRQPGGTQDPQFSVVIKQVTAAGAAAGMTNSSPFPTAGGAGPIFMLDLFMLLTLPTTGPVPQIVAEVLDDVNGTHPLVLAQGEGLTLLNDPLLSAAASSSVAWDISWAEVEAF
jgi:hypothetical protein